MAGRSTRAAEAKSGRPARSMHVSWPGTLRPIRLFALAVTNVTGARPPNRIRGVMIRNERTQPRRRQASPLCPACGAAMELIRVIPRDEYDSEQLIYECRACSVAVTQAPQ